MKKTKKTSPCDDCKEKLNFSLHGCAKKCNDFLECLQKRVFSKNVNPCEDHRCGIPNVKGGNSCEARGYCLILSIYLQNVGYGPKSKLGQMPQTDSFLYPYEGKYPWEGRRD